jgi:hypothetical protein
VGPRDKASGDDDIRTRHPGTDRTESNVQPIEEEDETAKLHRLLGPPISTFSMSSLEPTSITIKDEKDEELICSFSKDANGKIYIPGAFWTPSF